MSIVFYSWNNGILLLRVYVQPRASRDEIVGPHGDSLKIRITAPPVDGKANAHLLKYLAGLFGVNRKQIELAGGNNGRNKLFRIHQPARLPEPIQPETATR